MEGKDTIKELFSQKLGNYEVPVNPELWSSISSQIPAVTTTSVATGVGLTTKLLIGISVAASLVTGIYFLQTENKDLEVKDSPKTVLPSEVKQTLETDNKIDNSTVDNRSEKTFESKNQVDSKITENYTQSKTQNNVISGVSNPVKNDVNILVETNSNIEIKGNVEICPKSDVKAKEDSKFSENKVHIQNENIKPTVQTNSVLIPKESSIQFTLPNVFTPNGDGTNDYLETKIEGVNEFSVVVLNENGKVVYQSQDTDFKWDGTLPNGDKAPQGTYVYYITGKDLEGRLVSKHSRLTIKY
jgi:gliding motility-associated-like protein